MVFSKLIETLCMIYTATFFYGETVELSGTEFDTKITTVYNNPELSKSIIRGRDVYAEFCMKCHLVNGKGDAIMPPLDGSDWLTNKRKEAIYAVKFGQSGEITVNGKKYNSSMPPMGLTNQEIADVMNYVMNSWSNQQIKIVTTKEVESVLK